MEIPHFFRPFFDYFLEGALLGQKSNVFIMICLKNECFFRSEGVSSVLAAGLERKRPLFCIVEVSLTWGIMLFLWDFPYLR